MTTEPTPELSRDEVASSLLDAWRSKHGPQIPADLYANVLDPLLDEVFSIPLGIIWSVSVRSMVNPGHWQASMTTRCASSESNLIRDPAGRSS